MLQVHDGPGSYRGFLVGGEDPGLVAAAGPQFGYLTYIPPTPTLMDRYQGRLIRSHRRILSALHDDPDRELTHNDFKEVLGMQKDIMIRRCNELVSLGLLRKEMKIRNLANRRAGFGKRSAHYSLTEEGRNAESY